MKAPPSKVLSILFLNQTCSLVNQVRVQDIYDGWSTTLDGCIPWKSPGYDVTTASRAAVMVIGLHNLTTNFKLKVQIKAVAIRMKADGLITRYVSPVLGYIQTPGMHPFTRPFAGTIKGTAAVMVPPSYVTVISMVYFRSYRITQHRYNPYVKLIVEKNHQTMWNMNYRPGAVVQFDGKKFTVNYEHIEAHFFYGFRMLISFHQPSLAPQRYKNGLWNCSAPSWPDFHLHLVCNNKRDCAGREDEMWCPDTSCQQGGMLIKEKCYFFLLLPYLKDSWHHSSSACRQRGGALASFSTVNSWYHLALLTLTKRYQDVIFFGLQSAEASFPFITECPRQHRTQDFLVCDIFSDCRYNHDVRSSKLSITTDSTVSPACAEATFNALFPCHNGAMSVPYSLVCNHLQDCADNSDENFCVFPKCSAASQYTCTNGQCIQYRYVCDEVVQCVDESDEFDCLSVDSGCRNEVVRIRPPAVGDFDGRGWMVYTSLTKKRENRAVVCPKTHVFCPGDGYCLPVYVRCNGVPDCTGREDETHCDSYTCPGLYRCRGLLNTCLHPDHLCDGWSQCRQHDDELFCNLTCPVNCTCLGHAFICASSFQTEQFPHLRYLNADGIGLKPGLLVNNRMLVYLSLANCRLADLGNLTLPNLLILDLSDNLFSVITLTELNFQNLQNLSLVRNPLSRIFSGNYSSAFPVHESILHVDLTGVELKVLNMSSYLPFPSLLSLNLSESGITRMVGDGFLSLTSLRVLDLRGCPMIEFPKRIFKALKYLHLVLADNFKLCCAANLPAGFSVDNCHAPFDEVSSCDSLLRADIYRVFLSVLAALALSGNLVCFSLRIFSLTGRGKTGFNVFVSHLCLSDLLMGVYMAMIGVADRLYLGRYLWEEGRWRHSAACQVAGVLALLSSEVSAFIVCLITLDRFLVIRFPFSRLRFSSFSAQVAGVMTWTVGVVLVTVPFMPGTAYRHFYGQTGICMPLPVNRTDFAGRHYAFGVMILLNLVVFFLIATGQFSVYLSMATNAISAVDMTRKSRDLIVARRLIIVVVSDFLCWFPIGLMGVLATEGVPVPGEVNVAMAVFVLPLNSALNPFLYTLNIIQEKRRRATEVKLLKLIVDSGINDNEHDNKA